MNKKFVLLILTIGLVSAARSQNSECNCQSNSDYNLWLLNGLSGRVYSNPVAGYKGEHYFGEWKKGTLYLETGDSVTGVNLRYEKFLDELLFLNTEMKTGVLDKTEVKGFSLSNGSYDEIVFVKHKIKLPTDYDSVFHYMQLSKPGTASMLSLRRAVTSNSGNVLNNADKYYIFYQGLYYNIRLKRKDFISLPFANRKEMKSILHAHKLKVNSEIGMMRALDIYNASL